MGDVSSMQGHDGHTTTSQTGVYRTSVTLDWPTVTYLESRSLAPVASQVRDLVERHLTLMNAEQEGLVQIFKPTELKALAKIFDGFTWTWNALGQDLDALLLSAYNYGILYPGRPAKDLITKVKGLTPGQRFALIDLLQSKPKE